MAPLFKRHAANPIVTPGRFDWRAACFNPAVVHLYCGCCDTSIAPATAELDAVVEHVMLHRV